MCFTSAFVESLQDIVKESSDIQHVSIINESRLIISQNENSDNRVKNCIEGKSPFSEKKRKKTVGASQWGRLQNQAAAALHSSFTRCLSDHKNYEPRRHIWKDFTTNRRIMLLDSITKMYSHLLFEQCLPWLLASLGNSQSWFSKW